MLIQNPTKWSVIDKHGRPKVHKEEERSFEKEKRGHECSHHYIVFTFENRCILYLDAINFENLQQIYDFRREENLPAVPQRLRLIKFFSNDDISTKNIKYCMHIILQHKAKIKM